MMPVLQALHLHRNTVVKYLFKELNEIVIVRIERMIIATINGTPTSHYLMSFLVIQAKLVDCVCNVPPYLCDYPIYI